ncbi:antitoxin VbhA family protein [Xanthomonas campestris pv. campestris]|uniref:antitoxin VbhA family protein n=1 Tax=Xanthomonas campestris TaxID=339 RepID=UPI001E4B5A9D|nr:antitoxin VbhA family protein [Xanthomonas campestris]MCD0253079.1 antitoxin VbhA family protein [Xanthomonas campestris pv. campestris]
MTTKAQRTQALAEAAASLRLEGLAFDEANADLRKKWAEGSMSGDQVRREIVSRALPARTEDRKPVIAVGR